MKAAIMVGKKLELAGKNVAGIWFGIQFLYLYTRSIRRGSYCLKLKFQYHFTAKIMTLK